MITDYKIKEKTYLGIHKFNVYKRTLKLGKPIEVVSEVKVFSGSILECEAYIRLIDKKEII